MRLNEIQQALKVPKNHKNSFGGYNYRNAEDILEAVKPLLGSSVLMLSDEIVNIGNRNYVVATATFYEEGFRTEEMTTYVQGCAREEETKKGMDGAQITGAASSYARKYALNGLFLIDDTKDADSADNTQSAVANLIDYDLTRRNTPPKAVKQPQSVETPKPGTLSTEQKLKVTDLIKKLGGDIPKKKEEALGYVMDFVKGKTGLELIPESYERVVFALEEIIEARN